MRESTRMLIHYITGFIILITGAVHLISSNLVTFAWIKGTPLYPANQAIFLAAVLYHALNGLRVILVELMPSSLMGRIISYILLILGAALFIFGFYALMIVFGGW